MSVSAPSKQHRTEAGQATVPAHENFRLRHFLTSLSNSVRTEAVEILHIYHGAQDWR